VETTLKYYSESCALAASFSVYHSSLPIFPTSFWHCCRGRRLEIRSYFHFRNYFLIWCFDLCISLL